MNSDPSRSRDHSRDHSRGPSHSRDHSLFSPKKTHLTNGALVREASFKVQQDLRIQDRKELQKSIEENKLRSYTQLDDKKLEKLYNKVLTPEEYFMVKNLKKLMKEEASQKSLKEEESKKHSPSKSSILNAAMSLFKNGGKKRTLYLRPRKSKRSTRRFRKSRRQT